MTFLRKMSLIDKALGTLVGCFLGLLCVLFQARQSIFFESLESKTLEAKPVFNQVDFVSGWERDIWFMRQSHHGFQLDIAQWDRLAIVVDKKKIPH